MNIENVVELPVKPENLPSRANEVEKKEYIIANRMYKTNTIKQYLEIFFICPSNFNKVHELTTKKYSIGIEFDALV
ncbi:hypothetical protein [Marivirga sp.]|uniref:hypothetical protein n=1 Tax=Marivirga sp. TaxID=2018662 RepID=UPI002D7F1E2F|nr:hypothetical protein [Marivirga sp.]HET8858751.1 hypothetical protein [Marivirga sp.]